MNDSKGCLPQRRLGKLIGELAGPWVAGEEGRLYARRGRSRRREAGAGPRRELVFADRVVATLVVLRFQLPHAALAVFYRVDPGLWVRSGRCSRRGVSLCLAAI